MKIIHCADIHLDSKMETNLTAEQAAIRNQEICTTFSNMIQYAVNNNVDVVIIAGDMFDTERITKKTADYILDKIMLAPQIDFLYLRGNHDESHNAFCRKEIPVNLKLFTDSWKYYEYNLVTIAGIEINNTNCESLYQSLQLLENETNIVVMHGIQSVNPGSGLICIPLLKNRAIDYLALGHIHSYFKEQLDNRGCYCYSGCLEGRGFDECGDKGFVIIEINDKKISSEFIPYAYRKFYEIPVDITGLTTISDIQSALNNASLDISSDSLVKFVIKGKCNVNTQKDLGFLLIELKRHFFFVKIVDESRLIISEEDYRMDVSLKGEFIRIIMNSDKSDAEKEQIIRYGIQALSGEEIVL